MKEKYCVRIFENSNVDPNPPLNIFTEFLVEATDLVELLNWAFIDHVLLMEGTEHVFYARKVRGKITWTTV
jgi:hypothetical protein